MQSIRSQSRRKLPTMVILLAGSLCGFAVAQSGGEYAIVGHTIDNGGGIANGGSYTVRGSIAQPDAQAPASGGPFAVQGGFWPRTRTPEIPGDPALFNDGFE